MSILICKVKINTFQRKNQYSISCSEAVIANISHYFDGGNFFNNVVKYKNKLSIEVNVK